LQRTWADQHGVFGAVTVVTVVSCTETKIVATWRLKQPQVLGCEAGGPVESSFLIFIIETLAKARFTWSLSGPSAPSLTVTWPQL
jgi:hypothetical protein